MNIDPRLGQPISVRPAWFEIAPSKSADSDDIESGDANGILRGLVIHRLLQLSVGVNPPEPDATMLLHKVADEFCMRQSDNRLLEWWQEVRAVLDNRSLDWLTRPDADHRAYSEVPIAYRHHNQTVYGVIDRIVVGPEQVALIDYKTHRLDNTSVEQLASHYHPQLDLYREGVQRLWPDHSTRAYLLLTHECCLVDMP